MPLKSLVLIKHINNNNLLIKISWLLLVFSLPITSLAVLSRALGGTSVAPLSAIFLLILVTLWLGPGIIKGKGIPIQAIPILGFMIIAIITSLLSFFRPTPSFKNIPPWRNSLEGIITLGMGLCFYLTIALFVDNKEKLLGFIRLINYSGAVILVYSLIQAGVWLRLENYPDLLLRIQSFISSSGVLFDGRVTGLAFEPSWLAHQLNMLYLPIWFGMSLRSVTAHKFKIWKVSFENVLACFGMVILFFSYSRIGWLAFLAMIAYLFLRFVIRLSYVFTRWIKTKRAKPLNHVHNILIHFVFWIGFLVVFSISLMIAGLFLTKLDPRMAGLFNLTPLKQFGVLGWASRLVFAERLVYWITGFRVFLQHPFLGVGIGYSGYYFPETVNDFGYKLTEIVRILMSDTFIPNAKNLWVRILAETGIIGFSFFASWLYMHWKSANNVEKHSDKLIASFGLIGQIFLVGFILEGFSLDTFGLPYIWVSMGLIVAVYRIAVEKANSIEKDL